MASTTRTRRQAYAEDGFVVVPHALSRDDVDAAFEETARICRGERGDVKGLEPAGSSAAGDPMARLLCVHFPHKISALFMDLLAWPSLVEALVEVIGPDVKGMQSMLFIKAPGKPGQAWHQDENYIPTRDRSLCGVWIALDDASIENGCLWVLPGSHRHGVIWPSRAHGTADFDEGWESYGFPEPAGDARPVELEAGSAVLFNGYLLHRSLPNHTPDRYRRALVNHYMSAESLLPWDWDGRLAPSRDNRDIVMVAGADPYEYKGIESHTYPYLRNESAHPEEGLYL